MNPVTLDATASLPVPARRALRGSPLNRQILPIAGVVLLSGLLLALLRPSFGEGSNLYALMMAVSVQVLAVAGFVYVMALGEIDLSVGSVYGFTGALAALLMRQLELSFAAAAGISLLCAVLLGLINGLLTVRLRLNSLMLTIGTMVLIRGLGGVINTLLEGQTLARPFRALARTQIHGIHLVIILAVLLVLLFALLERRTSLFRRIYLVGESAATALLYGIRVDRIKIGAFIASALAAGMAGLVAASRVTHADAQLGVGLEFTLVTATVLGGASLVGGKGSLAGAFLGLAFLALVVNGMEGFDVNPSLQPLVIGVLLILAVAGDRYFQKSSEH